EFLANRPCDNLYLLDCRAYQVSAKEHPNSVPRASLRRDSGAVELEPPRSPPRPPPLPARFARRGFLRRATTVGCFFAVKTAITTSSAGALGDQSDAANASSRSRIRSSADSRPIERRITSGPAPAAWRC